MKRYLIIFCLFLSFCKTNDDEIIKDDLTVKAGVSTNNMTHGYFNPEYYLEYSFDECGYGVGIDSVKILNDYIKIQGSFLDVEAFMKCCPPDVCWTPPGLNYIISSANIEFAHYNHSVPLYNITFSYADTLNLNCRIDTLSNWLNRLPIWINDISEQHRGAWSRINHDYYLAIRMKDENEYKYGWIRIGQRPDYNLVFKEFAVQK